MHLSILITFYNGYQFLEDCIKSICLNFSDLPLNYEILILDNELTQRSYKFLQYIKNKYDFNRNNKINILFPKTNLGFGKGNNYLASLSHGDYLLILNQDTKIISLDFNEIKNYVNGTHHCNIFVPQLYNNDLTKQKQYFFYPSLFTILAEILFLKEIYNLLFNYLVPLINIKDKFRNQKSCLSIKHKYPSGAAFIIKKDIFMLTGGFDNNINMYHEEALLFHKIRRIKNTKVCLLNEFLIEHYGGSGFTSKEKIINSWDSLQYVYKEIVKTGCFNTLKLRLFRKAIISNLHVKYTLLKLGINISIDQNKRIYKTPKKQNAKETSVIVEQVIKTLENKWKDL